ncbi:MAG: hypothetical protein V3V92_00035 [Candidatus Hydrothermarchaeales archaeon]
MMERLLVEIFSRPKALTVLTALLVTLVMAGTVAAPGSGGSGAGP